MLENTEGTIKNGQSRYTGKIGYTRHREKTNQKHTPIHTEGTIRKWPIPKNWQNQVHKRQDKDEKQNKTYITIGNQTQITQITQEPSYKQPLFMFSEIQTIRCTKCKKKSMKLIQNKRHVTTKKRNWVHKYRAKTKSKPKTHHYPQTNTNNVT